MYPAEPYPQYYLYHRIVKAKLFIDQNYSENIELDNIADEANFSKYHFIRLFKNIYGQTPHQYLTKVRIEKAAIFLQQGCVISDTCYQVGFESITSFTGLFKKLTGQTPREYQQAFFYRQKEIQLKPLAFIPACFVNQNGWKEKSNFEEVLSD
jgi:AraC-like DNA-binding protein